MTKLKRSLCVILILITIATVLPMTAFASAGNRLSGDEKLAYDAMVPIIRQIASGQRTYTEITVGVPVDGSGVDAQVYFHNYAGNFDYASVMDALRFDLPYDLYWYNYSYYISWYYDGYGTLLQVTFSLGVAPNYRGYGDYQVSTQGSSTANTSANSAKSVVAANANKSDYEKLVAYKNYICNAVSYNDYAINNDIFSYNNDPWQMVYVFDNNSTTNVVCEGYSKAFKYLCDLSDFDDETFDCRLVTGWAGGSDGGGHMWNLVTLQGKNYLVDVTNSDSGSIGQDGSLFLVGSTQKISMQFTLSYSDGSYGTVTRWGYRFPCIGGYYDYYYDEETTGSWGSDTLYMAGSKFDPSTQKKKISIQPVGAGLAFKDEISYNVYFTISNPDNLSITEKGLLTWTGDREATIEDADHVLSGATLENGQWKVRSQAIAAKNMGEDLHMMVYLKLSNGTYVYSDVLDYSAKTYATNMLAKSGTDANTKALCVALLNYGAAAQQYFGYKTNDLMNADLTKAQQALAQDYSASMIPALGSVGTKGNSLKSTGGFADLGASVSFGGALGINYLLTPTNAVDGDVKLYVWSQSDVDKLSSLTLSNASQVITMTQNGGLYKGRVGEISARNAGETVYVCAVYESNGVTYRTGVLTYSVATYCKNIAAQAGKFQNVAKAAAVYTYYADLCLN